MVSYKMQRKLFYVYTVYYYMELVLKLKKSPAKMKKIQERNLQKLMKCAYEIPFYRERFEKAGVKPEDIKTPEDLKKLPVLTKEEYRAWMIEEEAKEENRECMKSKTSGSTGTPTPLLFSPREYAQDIAHALRTWNFCGYNFITKKTMTRMQGSSEQVGYKTIIQKFGIIRREMIDQNQPEQDVIEKINAYKPDLLQMCLPEFIRLAVYAKKHGISIHHPSHVYSLGEVIDENAEKIILEAYGDGLMSNYGCAEMGEVSTRRPGARSYYIHQDMYVANVYNKNGEIVLNSPGDIYLTSLYRDKFPLINYDVGDIGVKEVVDGREYFTEIRGRKNDCFYFDDGSTLTYFAIDGVVVSFANRVMQMKFVQKDYENILLYVVKDPTNKESKEQLEVEITVAMKKVCPEKVKYSFEWLDVIEPEKSGKIRMMVSEIQ